MEFYGVHLPLLLLTSVLKSPPMMRLWLQEHSCRSTSSFLTAFDAVGLPSLLIDPNDVGLAPIPVNFGMNYPSRLNDAPGDAMHQNEDASMLSGAMYNVEGFPHVFRAIRESRLNNDGHIVPVLVKLHPMHEFMIW